jgi:RimJ/RimL family protein N-acetyltransferase
VLCSITLADEDFYRNIRMQYSLIYRSAYYTSEGKKENLFSGEALAPQVFYCVIRDAAGNQPIGYLGIKDTSADLWEIAIEIDGKYTHQGYGSRSIRLYLNEIQRITGKDAFRALVEVDNIPSQECFEKLGAQLVGLCDSVVLKTDDEKERFEERNLDLIDAHMFALAERLGIEPRKLLSHVLDYRLKCPLNTRDTVR